MKTLSVEQGIQLLKVIQGVLPTAKWAPEESWLEDSVGEKAARRGSEPIHLIPCQTCWGKPNELVLFLKADLLGQHYNVAARIQHAVEKWAATNLNLTGGLTVDVRLFRVENRWLGEPTNRSNELGEMEVHE